MTWPADDPLFTVWQLAPDLTAAGEARRALRAWLSGLRIDSAEGVGADLVLVASELVANAVVHGKPPVWLAAQVDFSRGYIPALVISVTDRGGPAAAPADSAADAENGRGLSIMVALADWWEPTTNRSAYQLRAGFLAPGLSVPRPGHAVRNTQSGTVTGGTRTGLPPAASLSALI